MTPWVLLGAFVLLSVAQTVVLAAVGRRMHEAAGLARKLHVQQGNIVAMLLRAGFRPARAEPDWVDDWRRTSVRGEGSPSDTLWDLRKP